MRVVCVCRFASRRLGTVSGMYRTVLYLDISPTEVNPIHIPQGPRRSPTYGECSQLEARYQSTYYSRVHLIYLVIHISPYHLQYRSVIRPSVTSLSYCGPHHHPGRAREKLNQDCVCMVQS